MNIPFHLKRCTKAEPVAVLLPSHDVEDLCRLLVRLGCDPLPPVFAVADGFLVKLPKPRGDSIPGVLNLRALAEDLLVPVDAELVPALLADEASALVRQRGLILLPGRRVLEYARQPIPLPELIRAEGATHPAQWQCFPEGPILADRLTEITLDRPDPLADQVLAPGGEDIGVDDPRPDAAGLPSRVLGQISYGLGRGLAGLGKLLHWRGLARAGAHLMNSAMALVPRLSEALLGRQEASLRELLKYFRRGDIDKALRRAVPLNRDPQRGAQPDTGALPLNDIVYSLRDLLADGGPSAVWLSSADTYYELEREYRKQAEKAAREGDYRRAAFIYGKLLNDFRAAALVLAQGGLHRDAAVLYEKKLHDLLAAAREFEAAGDGDRALQLYRRVGDHLLAGDLLRRLGEEELAIAEYQLAADKLVRAGDHYQAGELLLTRGRRPDLARACYLAGWGQRPAGSCAPCALRLANLWARAGQTQAILNLVQEADDFYASPGHDRPAADFYNEIALLAAEPGLAAAEDELRDRALLGLATKMQQRLRAGTRPAEVVSNLMGTQRAWSAPVVRDAQVAATQAARPKPTPATDVAFTNLIPGRTSVVRAVCQAPESGAVFVGFENGEVVRFQPERGEILVLTNESAPILSLAVSPSGKTVVVLSYKAGQACLSSFSWSRGFRMASAQMVTMHDTAWLCPLLADDGDEVVGMWNGEEMHLRRARSLVSHYSWVSGEVAADAGLLVSLPNGAHSLGLLTLGSNEATYQSVYAHTTRKATIYWRPHLPPGSPLQGPPLAFLQTGAGSFQLAGIGAGQEVCFSALEIVDGSLKATTASIAVPDPYLAVSLLRPDQVAAVTRKGVHWLRRRGQTFHSVDATPLSLAGAVACLPHHPTNELLVVCREGSVARLPMQRF